MIYTGGGGSTNPNVNRLNNIIRGDSATWDASNMMSNIASLYDSLLGNTHGGTVNTTVGDPNTGYETPGGVPAQSGGGSPSGQDNYDTHGQEDLSGRKQTEYDGQGSPMSDPLQEDGPLDAGYGTPTTGNPEYYPETGSFPQTPMGDVYNMFFPPNMPMNFPEPKHDYTPPTFEGMELPETKFELPTAEVKPFGFADVGSRGSGYSQPLELTKPLAAEVMSQVGRKHPLEQALTQGQYNATAAQKTTI